MYSLKDYGKYVGQKVGSWTILELVHVNNRYMFRCKCDCGNEGLVKPGNIIRKTSTCCRKCSVKKTLIHQTTYGYCKKDHKDNRLYHILYGMHQRCYFPTDTNYNDYGARGIKICDEWYMFTDDKMKHKDEEKIKAFCTWARNNGYKDGFELTIDRIDPDKNYSPDNCRWLTKEAQASNTRSTKYSKTGYAGVKIAKNNESYISHISTKGKHIIIGTFNSIKEAVEARNQYIIDNDLPNLIQEYKGELVIYNKEQEELISQ